MSRRTRGAQVSGFTMLEMMVVLAISLLIMTMIVPVFQLGTKTVNAVQRKLNVYEAARNILDIIEADVKLACVNERGGRWSLKSLSWADDDPNTAISPPGFTNTTDQPGLTDAAGRAYKQSRRYADALDYVRMESCGSSYVNSQFRGGKIYPLQYQSIDANYPECWKASLRTTLLYQHMREWYSSDYEFSNTGDRWNRGEQLGDVSTIETAFMYLSATDQWWYRWDGTYNITRHYDAPYDQLGVGKETKMVPYFAGDQGGLTMRRRTGIKVMDLDISYWDDKAKAWKDPPDNCVIYFWPPPKAVRVTVTVCDWEKKSSVTLVRMIQVPVGLGDGVVQDTKDSFYEAPDQSFNRTKYLPTLPAVYDGDTSDPFTWQNDRDDHKDSKAIVKYKKPIGWP